MSPAVNTAEALSSRPAWEIALVQAPSALVLAALAVFFVAGVLLVRARPSRPGGGFVLAGAGLVVASFVYYYQLIASHIQNPPPELVEWAVGHLLCAAGVSFIAFGLLRLVLSLRRTAVGSATADD